MLRRTYIEQIRRLIYGGQPNDDATITIGLVNVWLQQAIGIAAAKNYLDNIQLDGVAYVNGSFYTTVKNLAVTKDETFLYKVVLPQIPLGLGDDEGISTCLLTDNVQNSYPIIFINQNQKSIVRGMRQIPNKLLGYSENKNIYIQSTFPLTTYTATVTMISGGDSTDLNSTLNIPDNYFPIMTEYLVKNLMMSLQVPVDGVQDGQDVNPQA